VYRVGGMKWDLRLACLMALGGCLPGQVAHAGASQALPTPYPEGRYREMCTRSPFAVATAAAAVAAATPGFATELFVDGVAHVGTSDFVAIKSRDMDKGAAVFLEVGQSTEDGIKIERVRWSDEMGKSTVEVSKGTEKATLVFDEAQMAKNAPAYAQVSQGPILGTGAGMAGPGSGPPVPQRIVNMVRRRGAVLPQ